MKTIAQMFAIGIFLLVILHAVGLFDPRPLPHRAIDALTNWGQGHAPEGNRCPPGTIRFETDDNLFLECYKGNRNE